VLLKDLGAKQKTIVLHFSAIIMISAYMNICIYIMINTNQMNMPASCITHETEALIQKATL